MTSPIALTFGELRIPPGYPTQQHAELYQAAEAFFTRDSVPDLLQKEFRSAWHAVVYRYIACLESAKNFSDSVERQGGSPLQAERYVQEREFFNFVVNGMACLETLHYGIFAWGACRQLAGFSLATEEARRKAVPKTVRDRLGGVPDAGALVSALEKLKGSDTYLEWVNLRIILFHRGLPGRIINMTDGEGSGTRYQRFGEFDGPEVTPDTSREMARWLTGQLQIIVPLAHEWVTGIKSAQPGASLANAPT
jgi:hypothetical protein